tara:strand:- start:529 stop:996 length:468 start_codon:yes stop_codon:yes gene_type:complete
MDFSDFAEFIGPLIFALIAWLSNYFNKKKKTQEKQPNTIEKQPNTIEKQPNNTNDLSIDKIFKTAFQEINNDNKIDQKIDENIELESDEKIIEVKDEKAEKDPIVNDKLNKKETSFKRKRVFTKKPKEITLSKKLKNKKSLKEAIIMKEILDRKY